MCVDTRIDVNGYETNLCESNTKELGDKWNTQSSLTLIAGTQWIPYALLLSEGSD
jgi:hypothetical protein